MDTIQKGRGLAFWAAAVVVAAVVLFFGSAVLVGIFESQTRHEAQKKASQLTDVPKLQSMIHTTMRDGRHPKAPVVCWYLGAIGFRLAEARDLKIPVAHAIGLANDQQLVEEVAKAGFNTRHVVGGVADQVYASPLSPALTFNAQRAACSQRIS